MMRKIWISWVAMSIPMLLAQTVSKSPIASNPVVELKGKIQKVQVIPGQGAPYVEVESGGKTSKVVLGSMRYLMEKNFNLKAGQEVVVKGYKVGEDVYASQVDIPSENKSLKLRDENGYPLWIQGFQRQGKGRHGRAWQ